MVDTQYLDNKIRSSGKSKTFLATKCGISRANFYMKIKGERHFTESEATKLCEELGVTTLAERKKIFLLDEWTKTSTTKRRKELKCGEQ